MGAITLDKDAIALAKLGYYQDFTRALGVFENFAASFSAMGFYGTIPALFGYSLSTGGPLAVWVTWLIGGTLGLIGALVLAEICSSMPTAGGIYFWAARLGGEKHGPLLSWLTAWWNWCAWIVAVPSTAQSATLLLTSAIMIRDPTYVSQPWHQVLLCCGCIAYSAMINLTNVYVLKQFFRFCSVFILIQYILYVTWIPAKAPSFQSSPFFTTFVNVTGFNDAYCWMIALLSPAYTFTGYDTSAHVAEETEDASRAAARGMWMSVAVSLFFSIPQVFLFLACVQDLDDIISYTYPMPVASFWIQTIGENGAITLLVLLWIGSLNGAAAGLTSASRVTYAVARDKVLPFSSYLYKTSSSGIPTRAVLFCALIAFLCVLPILGSTVAFNALVATSAICTNTSYAMPVIGRVFIAGSSFKRGAWHLGHFNTPLSLIFLAWIGLVFACLCLPTAYPVQAQNFNYTPVMVGFVTLVSAFGWIVSARTWFKGPQRLVSESEAEEMERQLMEKVGVVEA
ncbi:amino acid transporter [Gonapodya prolifera JEL478]|uniref:Amino acid transporter n=1 Tax=Gonapodya prolifera (strain JEL478) TaxID=1344416 RepID=A0A139A6J5_GONPJ|nr:amino acid transporter [Gonapodya prolifera JEL478]|eukprot:KXS12440.1 amino acid transporter [Gonapodya prolifera JEL478]